MVKKKSDKRKQQRQNKTLVSLKSGPQLETISTEGNKIITNEIND